MKTVSLEREFGCVRGRCDVNEVGIRGHTWTYLRKEFVEGVGVDM